MDDQFPPWRKYFPPDHYYGDVVRKLFLAAGFVMAVTYAFFSTLIPWPFALTLFAIIAMGIFAGFQNPNHRSVIALNAIISVGACIVFEYTAVTNYLSPTEKDLWFFATNEILAVIFFFSIYYATKSFRSSISPPTNRSEHP